MQLTRVKHLLELPHVLLPTDDVDSKFSLGDRVERENAPLRWFRRRENESRRSSLRGGGEEGRTKFELNILG